MKAATKIILFLLLFIISIYSMAYYIHNIECGVWCDFPNLFLIVLVAFISIFGIIDNLTELN